MTKTEIIEKIAGYNEIDRAENELFFEILLQRCSEILGSGESLNTPLGKFIYYRSADKSENELILFITNENEELFFDVPKKEEENFPVDLYFSISLGKPIIPLRDSSESEFFMPPSGDEGKRKLELKVESFIDEALKESEIEEQEKNEIEDIHFSFLNWKNSADFPEGSLGNDVLDEENPDEQEITGSLPSDTEIKENKSAEEQAQQTKNNQLFEKENKENENVTFEKTKEEVEEEAVKELSESEMIKETNEELITEDLEDQEDLLDVTEEWVDDLIEEQENSEKEISEEVTDETIISFREKKKEEIVSAAGEKETSDDENNSFVIKNAFKYAEDKESRIGNYKRKSYIGLIFAFSVIVVIGAVIYYSYYLSGIENSTIVQEFPAERNFDVVIERYFDNPVTYPYEKGMFAGTYNAISNEILNQPIVEETDADRNAENLSREGSVSKTPEIRDPLPTKRIKGYIYQYEDGMFAVQVSSWKSRSIALSETQKFLDGGYNAFIEQTEISSGTYYRVRVGGFKSLAEAEEFLRK